MMIRKFQKFRRVKVVVFSVVLLMFLIGKTGRGEENSYKYLKQKERFKRSSFSQFRTGLRHTIDGLEQKSDNLEAMNQNLEGRVNMLASEKDKLSKAHAQMRVKQSALENEQAKLKKKTVSLEVAYKKLSNKISVANAPKKTKSVAQKKSAIKTTKKKASTKKQVTVTTAKGKKDFRREKPEATVSLPSYPPGADEVKKPEEVKNVSSDELDIKKINERGIEYGKKGMYDAAIKEFQKVAAAEPNMANIHYNLGLAYKKKGMQSDADREFAEYERLKGQNN
ncbi:MAG: tetratricopeptide repeat protein [Candidatus Brocadia sp.]|nr:MAG: tetratricopeptide repeat protein [Candidatus Brocadia sp.]